MNYTNSGEDYLENRGLIHKPIEKSMERKHSDKSINTSTDTKETMNKDLVKHYIDIENKQEEFREQMNMRTWRSCCFKIDEKGAYFFSKLFISCAVLCLSSYQLIYHVDNCSVAIGYSGFISTIIGFWLGKIS